MRINILDLFYNNYLDLSVDVSCNNYVDIYACLLVYV